jgi:hypothetical protein
LDSNDAAILYRAGQVLAYFAKEFERGSTLIEQAVALNPNLSDIWAARGWTAIMNSDGERAIESFVQFFRISPNNNLSLRLHFERNFCAPLR